MEFFNITGRITKWTETLFKGATAQVTNQGHLCEPCEVTRGLKQGRCCSTYFFLICAEVLAIKLRENPNINGIQIGNFDKILGQFADDLDMYLPHKTSMLNKAMYELDKFQKNSGFKINYNKTTIYRIGSLKKSDAKIYTQPMLTWSNEPPNILGVFITTDSKETLTKINYDPIIQKMEAVLKQWSGRYLSIQRRITIVNTLVASLFVYKMSVLPTIPYRYIEKLNKAITMFIWKGRKPKISLKKLQLDKNKGGMNLVNFEEKDRSLKIAWIQILEENDEIAELAYKQLNYDLKNTIWYCNLNEKIVFGGMYLSLGPK